ncbi:hypothetical protein BGX29_009609 [Mortierella sp. GBA35]|nr:hypothetical protein BGX29_009609 [Mortierella sp. GBA35]
MLPVLRELGRSLCGEILTLRQQHHVSNRHFDLSTPPVHSNSTRLDTLCDKRCIPAILSYVVAFSPHVTVLELSQITIAAEFELQLLARALSGVSTLRSLTVEMKALRMSPEFVASTIIYSCPPLVEYLSLDCDPFNITRYALRKLPGSEDCALWDAVTTLLGTFPERKEALGRLKDWRLSVQGKPIDADAFVSFLRFLPELTSMEIPTIAYQSPPICPECTKAARQIVDLCPKLRHLRKCRGLGPSETMAFTIAEAMPENTLESFYSRQFGNYDDRYIPDLGLQRHSGSLKSIVFEELSKIDMDTHKNLLFEFPALEVFKIDEGGYSELKGITMEDLSSQPWSSTKFRDLKLVVTLGSHLLNGSTLFSEIDCTGPMPPWKNEPEAFFLRIGSLTDLRTLDLRVAAEWSDQNGHWSQNTYKVKTIPGMLVLEDQAAGRIGWLQLLAGLGNLEELRGSFNLDTMLHGFEFRQREADWIVTHWPRLGFIEFYTLKEGTQVDIPPAVQTLQERLPKLKVVKYYRGRLD